MTFVVSSDEMVGVVHGGGMYGKPDINRTKIVSVEVLDIRNEFFLSPLGAYRGFCSVVGKI